jgi:hypothetical protein
MEEHLKERSEKAKPAPKKITTDAASASKGGN